MTFEEEESLLGNSLTDFSDPEEEEGSSINGQSIEVRMMFLEQQGESKL